MTPSVLAGANSSCPRSPRSEFTGDKPAPPEPMWSLPPVADYLRRQGGVPCDVLVLARWPEHAHLDQSADFGPVALLVNGLKLCFADHRRLVSEHVPQVFLAITLLIQDDLDALQPLLPVTLVLRQSIAMNLVDSCEAWRVKGCHRR